MSTDQMRRWLEIHPDDHYARIAYAHRLRLSGCEAMAAAQESLARWALAREAEEARAAPSPAEAIGRARLTQKPEGDR